MSMRNSLLAAALFAFATGGAHGQTQNGPRSNPSRATDATYLRGAAKDAGGGALEAPDFGESATPGEIASYDIDAEPDGSGLPPGSGTPKQGEAVYVEKCQSCHGEKGVHGPALALAGGEGTIGKRDVKPLRTIGSYWPYATSVFAYIRRAMPFYDSKTLSNDELYAITAYLLNINHIIDDDDVMNAATLPKVVMPWHDHFRPFVRGD